MQFRVRCAALGGIEDGVPREISASGGLTYPHLPRFTCASCTILITC
jgi:hypothetical protein